MTRLCVPIMVHALAQAHADAARAAELGADLVEYRIDRFVDDPPAITTLVEQSPLACIITCRTAREGGHFTGSEQTRIHALEHACRGPRQPAYIDIELEDYLQQDNLRRKIDTLVDHADQHRSVSTGLILSSHDFRQRPADLLRKIAVMAEIPACRVIKLAWQARSLRDNLEAFDILRQQIKPTIALCMGEYGLASRVLAHKFNALLTFASLEPHRNTAPGQPTIQQLKSLYRWDAIEPDTRVYAVIGHPVGHSMSPPIHNAGFDAINFNGIYLPMPIPPEYEHFKATVSAWLEMKSLHFMGASVTIPHKENLLRFVKEAGGEIEPLAQSIGAANTLTVRDDGSLHAGNSDYAAALDAVCDSIGIDRPQLAGKRVAVIGAGGAARAIVAGFAAYGATVVIYNRTLAKAQALAATFNAAATATSALPKNTENQGKTGKIVAATLEKLCDSCCEIFINCTPIGMHPHPDASPLDNAAEPPGFGPGTVVFDTIYNPSETKLLRQARAAGCVTIPGTEMFIRQAAMQFTAWTRQPAPLPTFRNVLHELLP